MAMASIKSFAKELRKILIYKITPAQRKLIVYVYITHKTNFQILLYVTWGRLSAHTENVNVTCGWFSANTEL